jgi:amidase
VGPYLEDRTTIAFAHLLEQVYGGFIAPPGYEVGTAGSAGPSNTTAGAAGAA